MRIFLEFIPSQSPAHRCRLAYAFRVFCAVYGHKPVVDPAEAVSSDACISYANPGNCNFRRVVFLSDSYVPRSLLQQPAPPPRHFSLDGYHTVLFYSYESTRQPDWLAEIFEWISCADEYHLGGSDQVGCSPFAASYIARHKLNVKVPYAAIAMRLLQRALCAIVPQVRLDPPSPVASVRHFVVPTHDVDFLALGRFESVRRLAKNALISLLLHKSLRTATDQVKKAAVLALSGDNPLDQLMQLASNEAENRITATFFFLTYRHHRRDGNYNLDDPRVLSFLQSLRNLGMEVGVHGSYTSLDESGGLTSEYRRLRELGFSPLGSRQHWLRFTMERMMNAAEEVGAAYEMSVGWHQVGFRAGACFPFPPYNFQQERPADFLEVPLIMMDWCLLAAEDDQTSAFEVAADLLDSSRRYGWGGISVLWHPTAFGGGQLPDRIGRVFWDLIKNRAGWNDTWMSGEAFVKSVRYRYEDVGLLSKHPVRGPW